jgi:hypothetical protein
LSICSREIKRSISQKGSAAKLSERDFGFAISLGDSTKPNATEIGQDTRASSFTASPIRFSAPHAAAVPSGRFTEGIEFEFIRLNHLGLIRSSAADPSP